MRNGYAEHSSWGIPEGYYDRDGQPIELMRWADLAITPYRYVARTAIGDDGYVSTIWNGIPGAVMSPPPGLIFETMVFAEGSPLNQGKWLHRSLDEAIEFHDMMASTINRELTEKPDV